MADPTGEADRSAMRLAFDRRLMLQFCGSTITSDAGLLAYRELDDARHLTDTAADRLADARTGKNGRHRLEGLLRQSVFGRLAGYEDVNDAERLCHDPAMRWVVGDRTISGSAASASQMGRFETRWLSRPENLAALARDHPGIPGDFSRNEHPGPRSCTARYRATSFTAMFYNCSDSQNAKGRRSRQGKDRPSPQALRLSG